jgi:hypothetical protein
MAAGRSLLRAIQSSRGSGSYPQSTIQHEVPPGTLTTKQFVWNSLSTKVLIAGLGMARDSTIQ